jgi:alpha-galactosidase
MNKVVIIGAGSAMFTKNLVGDLMSYNDMTIDTISLVDIDEEKLSVMEKVAKKIVKQFGRKTVIEASTDRCKVLTDATFVTSTIGIGGADMYEKDLEIPDKYGLHQCVGDIIGPGGMFRFLRAYPVLLAICKDMERLCPDAYFFNYTNPMAPLCLALNHATTIKVFGFCHNVQSTALQLSAYMGVERDRVSHWAAGINHMDWFLKLTVDGKDAYPRLKEISKDKARVKKLVEVEPDYSKQILDPPVRLVDLIRFEIMDHFDYFVSESSFHMGEYCPYFRKNWDMIKEYCVEDRWWLRHEKYTDVYYNQLIEMLDSGKEIPVKKTFEYAPEIIHAYITGKPFRANLNVMNTGLISNLPSDSVVEVPCYTDSEGIHPCYVGEIPQQLAALNITNINMHKLMAMAGIEKKFSRVREAVKMDPLTGAMCTLKQIDDMVDELIEANKEYLKDFS